MGLDIGVNLKKFIAASILILLPFVAVRSAKKTPWGGLQSTPPARQKGEANAKLVIVEFSDFQCPNCATIQPAIHQFLETYKGKIKFVYKYYPLTRIHKHAMTAARAAECAARQEKFWPMHDRLFQWQGQWSPMADATAAIKDHAKAVGLDMPKFEACFADPSIQFAVEADAQEAKAREVAATPTFFVGEQRLVGNVFMTDGARAIERELRNQ